MLQANFSRDFTPENLTPQSGFQATSELCHHSWAIRALICQRPVNPNLLRLTRQTNIKLVPSPPARTLTVTDVLPDGDGKQDRLLRDNPETAPQPGDTEIGDTPAVQQHLGEEMVSGDTERQ